MWLFNIYIYIVRRLSSEKFDHRALWFCSTKDMTDAHRAPIKWSCVPSFAKQCNNQSLKNAKPIQVLSSKILFRLGTVSFGQKGQMLST